MTDSGFQLKPYGRIGVSPLRGSGSRVTRGLGQIRFVEEDDYSARSRSEFFRSDHALAFHAQTALPSRSRAWPVYAATEPSEQPPD
jgi:hypothetical protein